MSLAELLTDLPDTAVHTLVDDVSREDLVASANRLSSMLTVVSVLVVRDPPGPPAIIKDG